MRCRRVGGLFVFRNGERGIVLGGRQKVRPGRDFTLSATTTQPEADAMQVQPYLFFDGRCEEALEFYRGALGAKVEALMRFKESPDPRSAPEGGGDKVMHSSFRIGETTVLASDGHCTGKPSFQGFALSLNVSDDAEAKRLFEALSDGGAVQMPLSKTFFASSFGMVADRFGVTWMVYVAL
jgi:PhnB protein